MSERLPASEAMTLMPTPSSLRAAARLSGFRPVTATFPPSACSSFAVAKPMPVVPPVTNAVLPSKRFIVLPPMVGAS